uniref:Uncharacterized protein n=1 Tax=Steinernema glaseri TaxID=37863 RepID=A0A1I7ZH27_9BILA
MFSHILTADTASLMQKRLSYYNGHDWRMTYRRVRIMRPLVSTAEECKKAKCHRSSRRQGALDLPAYISPPQLPLPQ